MSRFMSNGLTGPYNTANIQLQMMHINLKAINGQLRDAQENLTNLEGKLGLFPQHITHLREIRELVNLFLHKVQETLKAGEALDKHYQSLRYFLKRSRRERMVTQWRSFSRTSKFSASSVRLYARPSAKLERPSRTA
ncbi:hypothetical protein RhiJN_27304 [Ceratobasidium sp. AG-Ba]|nr:hypothetical protein RhiJN_13202 [Ceratobasidium sp. AG-Ba]QRV99285.1 hypothetical protein RhiJN_27304 [Ceratobasidium sp. AG-Ba]